MTKISIEKITKELDKGTLEEQIEAFRSIKENISQKMNDEIAKKQAEAEMLISKKDKL
jgi:hypothetical protein